MKNKAAPEIEAWKAFDLWISALHVFLRLRIITMLKLAAALLIWDYISCMMRLEFQSVWETESTRQYLLTGVCVILLMKLLG